MRLALVIALGVTGCFSDRGVAIEVDVGGTGATTVELHIGKDACDPKTNQAGISCMTIAPAPAGTPPLPGKIWFRDDLAPYTAAVKGRKATFVLKSDTDDTLPIVIAVGSVPANPDDRPVGTATLREIKIPANSARVVTTTLVGANPLQPKQNDNQNLNEDRVMVWRKLTPPSSCVVVEHWRPGQQPVRTFVVPEKDPDCDDVTPECNPAAYHGTNTGSDAEGPPNCFAQASPLCVLGSLGCTDGGPSSTKCIAQRNQVCVPSHFCECPRLDEACLQQKVMLEPTIPRITCTVPSVDAGICQDKRFTINLDGHYPNGDCGQPVFALPQLAGFAQTRDFSGAMMELSGANQPCSFEIKARSGTRAAAMSMDAVSAIKLETSRGALLVPLVLRFVPVAMCTSAVLSCTVMDNQDPLWSCAP